MKHIKTLVLTVLCINIHIALTAQDGDVFRMAFYNVENLFDTQDDPLTSDDDFTPRGRYMWTSYRHRQKTENIARVISDIRPSVMGMCEVENEQVMARLTESVNLRTGRKYACIHAESRDERGMDPAFIYDTDAFEYLNHDTLCSPQERRCMLHVTGRITDTGDTLHVLVCHWTSRYMGRKATEASRKDLARVAGEWACDTHRDNPTHKIIICGDFNDTITDVSLRYLKHLAPFMNRIKDGTGVSSYYYGGKWYAFDQFFTNFVPNTVSVTVFSGEYLFHRGGYPLRTYAGDMYAGGYSDHLPVYADYDISH